LDAFGDPAKVGKKPGGDIAQNKKTYLYLKALELASPPKAEELRKYFTTGYVLDEAEKIEAVVSIFRELKVAEAVNQVKETYWQTALDALSKISSVGPKKTILEEFASALISRDF